MAELGSDATPAEEHEAQLDEGGDQETKPRKAHFADMSKTDKRKRMKKWLSKRHSKRGEVKFDSEEDDNYSWDYCIVFAVGDEEETVEVKNKKGKVREISQKKHYGKRTARLLNRLEDAGLETKLFRSIQGDEIYCLVGASEKRLKVEAERSNFRLKLDPEQALSVGLERKPAIRLAVKTDERDRQDESEQNTGKNRMCTHDNWENLFVRYDLEIEQGLYMRYNEGPAHPNSLFRTVDRMKLTVSIMEADIEAGGAALDTGSRKNKGKNNPTLDCFPLHQQDRRDALLADWFPKSPYYNFEQPLERIRDYFGEKIGLYFAFLGFYTKMLYIPALFGIAFFIPSLISNEGVNYRGVSVFGLIIALWATLFLEFWKRREAHLRTQWGQSEFRQLEQPRPQFKGDQIYNPVNGAVMEWFEPIARVRRECCSSTVIFSLILLVLAAVSGIFVLRVALAEFNYGSYLVSVINAVQIQIFNFIYGYAAEKLTEWENHETDTAYEDALIAKSFLFKFVNSYNTLYYIAFIKAFNEGCGENASTNLTDCLPELEIQLGIVFATIIFMNNSIEYFTPIIMNKIARYQDIKGLDDEHNAANVQMDYQAMPDQASGPEDEQELVGRPKRTEPERERTLSEYRTFEDYDELIIQFGYVALFITAFPLTPLLALLNNFVEIWLDSNKVCKSMRRPEPRGASDIGTWKTIINIMIFLIIVTNLALVTFVSSDVEAITDQLNGFPQGAVTVALFFIVEHVLLLMKVSIDFAIPDVSRRDKTHLARQQYLAGVLIEKLEETPDAEYYKEQVEDDTDDEHEGHKKKDSDDDEDDEKAGGGGGGGDDGPRRVKRIKAENIPIGYDQNADPHYMSNPVAQK